MLEDQAQLVTYFREATDPEEMLCVWAFEPTPPWGVASAGAFVHDAYDAFASRLLPFMTDNYNLVRVTAQWQLAGGIVEVPWVENQPGAVNVDSTPQNTAYLIHKRTAMVGRGKNGRAYIPGVREDEVSNSGVIGSTWADSISDSVTQLMTDFNGADLPELGVNHGYTVDPTDPPPRLPTVPPATLWSGMIGMDCDLLAATQRGRLRR